MSHSNISIFVPHVGCPHMCIFCNQRTITGQSEIPHAEDVIRICTQAMKQVSDISQTEIAFFGGSFTAVPREYMLELLEAAYSFVGRGKFKGIRLSTRPDYIDKEVLDILKSHGVTAIELGAQSLSDTVLIANERGHSVADVENASRLIKEYGFELGLQMMIGLYKSTEFDEFHTAEKIIELGADTVRIYPVVILGNTKLGKLYTDGDFIPFSFDKVIDITSECMNKFRKANVRIIKVGLHSSEDVEKQMVGGFYHPALRELCEARIYRSRIENALVNEQVKKIVVSVIPSKLSQVLGQKKSNIEYFQRKNIELCVTVNRNQTEDMIIISIE